MNQLTRSLLPFTALLIPAVTFGQGGTSDCGGAIELCGGVYTEDTAPLTSGNVLEYTGACNAGNESASIWYVFTVQESGDLSFIIDPAVDADDYDWGLFNISNGGCAGINAQNGTSPEVSCNSYGSFITNGPTGISTAEGGTGNSNGPGDLNGPAFNADLPVVAGETYALVVMNWSNSPDGYTIDFGNSTASLFDSTTPAIVEVTADCVNQTLHVAFSEPVLTATLTPPDLVIQAPDGTLIPVASIIQDEPGVPAQAGFTLNLSASIPTAGEYVLTVTSVAGNIEDVCGNAVVETTFPFLLETPLQYEMEVFTACNGSNGRVEISNIRGGTLPVTFSIPGAPFQNGVASGLGTGNYLFTLSDAAGCVLSETITIPDHALDLSVPAPLDSLSCSETAVTIDGATVTPVQTVDYQWTQLSPTGAVIGTEPTLTVTAAGPYTLTVTEPITGCSDQATVFVGTSSNSDLDLSGMVLPNTITPNGDGKNDVWRPYLPTLPELDLSPFFDTFELVVMDRWGQEQYRSTGSRYWSPRDIVEGTYYYIIDLKAECGTVFERRTTGAITVLR
jgi:hypothetical protein